MTIHVHELAGSGVVLPIDADATGSTDSTASLQRWLNRVAVTGTGYLPDGDYLVDGSLTYDGSPNWTLQFGGRAFLCPMEGRALTARTSQGELYGFKAKLIAGSIGQGGFHAVGASRLALFAPRFWSYIDIPADVVCFDIDDNSYWCDIFKPSVRKYAGALAGQFKAGVRFRKVSNRGTVWGGDLNHSTHGIIVDGSNSIGVERTAFEDCGDGVGLVDPTAGGSWSGLLLSDTIAEATRSHLDISGLTSIPANTTMPQILGFVGAAPLYDPNNLAGFGYPAVLPGGVAITDIGRSITMRGGSAPAIRITDNGGSLTISANGDIDAIPDRDNSGSGDFTVRPGNTERLRTRRSDGRTAFLAAPKLPVYTTAARPSASTLGQGAQVLDSTLNKVITSDGTDWRDAAGTVV